MPRYDYECQSCGWRGDRFSPVEDRNRQRCRCNWPLKKLLSAPRAKAIFPTQYQKDMRRKGMVEIGDASLSEVHKWDEQNRIEGEAVQARALDQATEEVINELGELGDNLLVSE